MKPWIPCVVSLVAAGLLACPQSSGSRDSGPPPPPPEARAKALAEIDRQKAATLDEQQRVQSAYLAQLEAAHSADAGTEPGALASQAYAALRSSGLPLPDGGVMSREAYEIGRAQVALADGFQQQVERWEPGTDAGSLEGATEQFKQASEQQRTEAGKKGKQDQLQQLLQQLAPGAVMAGCMLLGGEPSLCAAVADVLSSILGGGGSYQVADTNGRKVMIDGLMKVLGGQCDASCMAKEIGSWPIDPESASKIAEALGGAAKKSGLDVRQLESQIAKGKDLAKLLRAGAPCVKGASRAPNDAARKLVLEHECVEFWAVLGGRSGALDKAFVDCLHEPTLTKQVLCFDDKQRQVKAP